MGWFRGKKELAVQGWGGQKKGCAGRVVGGGVGEGGGEGRRGGGRSSGKGIGRMGKVMVGGGN